jgi:hypothetical protein
LSSWRFDEILSQLCGQACLTDLSLGITALVAAYPRDRMSLLSSYEDKTISTFLALSPKSLQIALTTMAEDRIAPTSNFHFFFTTGDTHTMLADVAHHASGSMPLWTWLNRLVGDDPAWVSTP